MKKIILLFLLLPFQTHADTVSGPITNESGYHAVETLSGPYAGTWTIYEPDWSVWVWQGAAQTHLTFAQLEALAL